MFIIIGMQSCYCTDMSILTRTGKNSSHIAERYNLIITRGQGESHSVMSDSLQPHGLYSPRNSLGQNTGVGSLFLLQGIFPTQGSNPGLPHWRQILYQLSHKGSPRRVAYPFSSISAWSRNQTRVSCIAGGFFPNWAMRGSQLKYNLNYTTFLLLIFSKSHCL